MNRKKLEDITRRSAMQLGAGTLTTLFVAGVWAEQIMGDRTREHFKKSDQRRREDAQEMANGGPLKVRYFAPDIISTAASLVEYAPRKGFRYSIASFFGGFSAMRFYSHFRWGSQGDSGLEAHHSSGSRWFGGIASTAGAAWDLYTTFQFARTFSNPKFKEYGLDGYVLETHSSFSLHPTPTEVIVKGVPLSAEMGLLGALFPSAGSGLTAAKYLIGKDNLKFKETMLLSYALGEKVEERILKGNTQAQIMNYLSGVRIERSLDSKGL